MKVPTSGPHPITLLDLATHSAGLPREMPGAPPDVNPRAWPTRADRWKWLPNDKLPRAPPYIAAYSNVGFNLLADGIETAAGQSYPDLLRARVAAPLGMVDTGFAPTPEQCRDSWSAPVSAAPRPASIRTRPTVAAKLYSTGDDMARWLRHNLDDPDRYSDAQPCRLSTRQSLPAAIGFDEAGPMAGLGLGWVTVASDGIRPMLVAKSGGGAGFMSYVAFAPGRDVGLFVAVNRVDFAMFFGLTARRTD